MYSKAKSSNFIINLSYFVASYSLLGSTFLASLINDSPFSKKAFYWLVKIFILIYWFSVYLFFSNKLTVFSEFISMRLIKYLDHYGSNISTDYS